MFKPDSEGSLNEPATNSKRTAILVIHGMGRQKPFQTVGIFCQNLVAALGNRFRHQMPQLVAWKDWHQSRVRIALDNGGIADIFEYYWAPLTGGRITLPAVYGWLLKSVMVPYLYIADHLRGGEVGKARHQKRVRSELLRLALFFVILAALIAVGAAYLWVGKWILGQKEIVIGFFRGTSTGTEFRTVLGVIHLAAILIGLWAVVAAAASVYWGTIQERRRVEGFWFLWGVLAAGLALLGGFFYTSWPWYGALFHELTRRILILGIATLVYFGARWVMVEYVGDVALYLSSNVLSKYYEVRKKILDGAVETLENILLHPRSNVRDPEISEGYEQIILVAHSLGSVIAYDAMNRIIVRSRTIGRTDPLPRPERIRLFVTMGSPLDKVYYFFRERIPADETKRKEIIDSLYPLVGSDRTILPDMEWVNFWTPKDPVSGYLDAYPVTENRECREYEIPVLAHTRYWFDRGIYDGIAEKL